VHMAMDQGYSNAGGPAGGVWEIDHGWDVFSSDGDKIGDVEEVQPHYLTVSKGFFFPSEKYVPVSAITSVDGERVYVSATKSEIDNLGWDTIPDDTTTSYTDTTSTSDYTDTMDTTRGVTTGAVTDTTGYSRGTVDDDDIEVTLSEEELSVSKREVERGRVIVRKGVRTEQQTVNVPLREEEVHVERHAVSGEYTGNMPANAFQEQEIEIQLHGEEVDVTKQARVREVVEIDKDVVEHNERVTDTVRREEVFIEGDGVIDGETGTTRGQRGTSGTTGT